MRDWTREAVLALTCVVPLALGPAGLHADGDPQAGREKAKQCESCHGTDGRAVEPSYPNLAGQYESYLIKALSDYRSGARDHAIMKSFAANLSNQDIEDLSAWYSSQKGLEDISIK